MWLVFFSRIGIAILSLQDPANNKNKCFCDPSSSLSHSLSSSTLGRVHSMCFSIFIANSFTFYHCISFLYLVGISAPWTKLNNTVVWLNQMVITRITNDAYVLAHHAFKHIHVHETWTNTFSTTQHQHQPVQHIITYVHFN